MPARTNQQDSKTETTTPATPTPTSDEVAAVELWPGATIADLAAATDTRTVHQRMVAVLRDLPAIGKDQVNEQQGFSFRGVDDVLNALNPLLAKHGVYVVPDVVERVGEQRPTRSGGVMHVVHLHVRYGFHGLGGDCVYASGWGEGTDSGDKATAKAMTGAFKYVLFQAFSISVAEASDNDADRSTPDDTVPYVPAPDDKVTELRERVTLIKAQDAAIASEAATAWKTANLGSILENADPHHVLAADDVAQAEEIIEAAEAKVLASATPA